MSANRKSGANSANSHFTDSIITWYHVHRRDLPWRDIGDPYAIWISEVILQQTRIDQGTDYWHRFMQRFPTVAALAQASEDEVLRLWQGLGYYSRARNLHHAAQQIIDMGGFPTTYNDLKRLKGVGDYTAAAIASMAFGEPVATVDGNVFRVLARHFGIDTPINTTQGKKMFSALAQELLPAKQASAFNQAMMDFGATLCTPRNPQCHCCPLADSCRALQAHQVNDLPVKLKKTKIVTRHFHYVYLRCDRHTALRRRPAGDIWQGLWEPFMVEEQPVPCFEQGKPRLIKSGVKHVLTHRIIMADFYLLDCATRPTLTDEYHWIAEQDIDHYALPRLVERLLEALDA